MPSFVSPPGERPPLPAEDRARVCARAAARRAQKAADPSIAARYRAALFATLLQSDDAGTPAPPTAP